MCKVIYFFIFLSIAGVASPQPLGRYVGVIRHESLKRDQLAKLDFIASREEHDVLHLKAVLTLHFGDFKSGEYIGYHFNNVRFNLLTQTLIFNEADEPITLVAKQFSEDELLGEFRSSFSSNIGKIILRRDRVSEPNFPLIESIWGEYQGKCYSQVDGKRVKTHLQLHTVRSQEGGSQVGNPFGTYRITGFIGEEGENRCALGERLCVWGNIASGSYNFFENRLVLFSNYKNLTCETSPDGLLCSGCDPLKRISDEIKTPRAFQPPEPRSLLSEVPAPREEHTSAIQGEYRGFVHHEYLDRYQLGGLNILTYQAQPTESEPATLRMSAVGSLHFGDGAGLETLSYKFDERSYPNPLMTPQFTFSQAESDVDAIVQVTSIGKGEVRGIWYSRLFGRVGNFVFQKNALPELPQRALRMESIGGYYEGREWELNILVGMGTAPANTRNPFAPLTFGGFTIWPGITRRNHIDGGTYDFYTGKIAFFIGNDIWHLGERDSRERMRLRKMYLNPLSALPDFPLIPYRLVQE